MKLKWRSFGYKLIILAFGTTLLFGMFIILTTSSELLDSYEISVNEKNTANILSVKETIETQMYQVETAVDALSHAVEDLYPQKLNAISTYEDSLIDLFSDYLESELSVSYSVYAYFEPESKEDTCDVWMTNIENSLLRHEKIPYERYVNKDNMTWYYEVENKPAGYWVTPYRNRYNEYISSFVKGLYHNEQFVGILGMYYDANRIRNNLSPLNIDDKAFYWVINKQNKIIYHPVISDGDMSPLSFESEEPFIMKDINGQMYRHYFSTTHNDWTFILSVKESSILEDRKVILRKVFISFIMFVGVMVALMVMIVKKYLNIIQEMAISLNKAQHGNFSKRVDITTQDEFGVLSQVINDTLDKVSNDMIKLERLCYYNNETNLPNLEKLKHDLMMYNDRDMALYLLNLNNYRMIDDLLGKSKSDAFLKEIGQKLREAEEKSLYVYHISGDEFAFLEFSPELNQISENAEFIINLFKQMAYSTKYQIGISISIGIAKYPDDVSLSGGLIECAHIALNSAKKEGKNNYQLFSRFLPTKDSDGFSFREDIKKAIQRDEFTFYYQPVFNRDNEVVSMEALIRWYHPTEGILHPSQFLDHIEHSGLINEFSQVVLTRVCHDYKTLVKDHPGLIVSINVSHRQLLNPLFISNSISIIRNEKISADSLSLEITEDILRYDMIASKKKLEALRVLGIHIELDDFGAGEASLNTLKNLPLSKVKIDCSLITKIPSDPLTEKLVHGIIDMCHQMNLSVIAECVESEHVYKILYKMGCDEFQGHYLQSPKPVKEG